MSDNTGSDPAQINMPLAQGVRVTTGQDGQAEIEFEDGSLVRLTPNSSLELTALTADANGNLQTDLTLVYGLVYAELRAAAKFAYSVDAGGVQVSPVDECDGPHRHGPAACGGLGAGWHGAGGA